MKSMLTRAIAVIAVGVVACGVAVVAAPGAESSVQSAAALTQSEPCLAPHSNNPILDHISGNSLIDRNANIMAPYGLTVLGMATQDWQDYAAGVQPNGKSIDVNEIDAAIGQWCTNYVRLQIAPANLVPNCNSDVLDSCNQGASCQQDPNCAGYVDQAFLTEIKNEVQEAISYHQNVILSAQTEKFSSNGQGWESNPNEQTDYFWQILAPIYHATPRIWFDLFNEPHLCANGDCSQTSAQKWDTWLNGGTVNGHTYVGMQQLVNDVRAATGNNTNLILLEGINWGSTLNGLPSISGSKTAYAVHTYTQTNRSTWNSHFGNEAATVPVIVDEWSEWATTKPGKCHDGITTQPPPSYVQTFFKYLLSSNPSGHAIGLGAWGLIPGADITENKNFTPSVIIGSGVNQYKCDISQGEEQKIQDNNDTNGIAYPNLSTDPVFQGVGQELETYFRTNSGIKET